MGGETNHAKYVSVCSVKTVSCKPARKTRTLAAYRSHRIGVINGRTLGEGPRCDILDPRCGNAGGHTERCRRPDRGRPLIWLTTTNPSTAQRGRGPAPDDSEARP